MTKPIRLVAVAAALMMSAAALTACENKSATTVPETTEATVGDGSTDAGNQLQEEAAQVGSAIEAGAKEAAQEIDQATDKLAANAEEAKADTAAEAQQDNTGKQ